MAGHKKAQQQPSTLAEVGDSATDAHGAVIDGATGRPVTPTPRKRKHHVRLDTLADVKAEFGRLYRATKNGEIEPATASRLGYLLNSLAAVIADSDLERRIEDLEKSK